MSEDYFDDASDADFLAVVGNIDSNGAAGSSRATGGAPARPTANRSVPPRPPAASTSEGRSTTNQPIPKVLRPGFNAIIVNTRQVKEILTKLIPGNPILEHVRNVPWEYGDILPDYVLGATTCALFLSLKYHRLHPEYIYNRIQKLGKEYNLRILLIMENHSDPLRELTKTSLVNDLTIILAWSNPEAGRYLETFKSFEHANSNLIKQHQATDYPTRLIETLTTIRSVNKNDAVSLVTNFGSLTRAINAPPSQIATLGGWGPQKLERFQKTVTEPFIIKTGTGGAIGQRKNLKGGRWMVDQEGANVMEDMERNYANAGNASMGRTGPVARRKSSEDERMPDEWNRARNQEGEVVGYIGQRPIRRAVEQPDKDDQNGDSVENGVEIQGDPSAGVMAALARLRQENQ